MGREIMRIALEEDTWSMFPWALNIWFKKLAFSVSSTLCSNFFFTKFWIQRQNLRANLVSYTRRIVRKFNWKIEDKENKHRFVLQWAAKMREEKGYGAEPRERTLGLTPTWSVASVLTVFVIVSLIVERSIHRLSNVSSFICLLILSFFN